MKNCDLFAGISETDFICIYSAVRPTLRQYSKNEIVLNAGSESGILGILVTGRLVKMKVHGKGEEHLISVLGHKDLIGLEGAASSLRTNPFTIRAKEEAAVLTFDFDNIWGSDHLNKNIKFKLMQNAVCMLADENIRQLKRVEILSTDVLRKRVMTFLYAAQEASENNSFCVNMNQTELADFLCVNRSSLSSMLNQLKKEGILSFRRDCFTIHEHGSALHESCVAETNDNQEVI